MISQVLRDELTLDHSGSHSTQADEADSERLRECPTTLSCMVAVRRFCAAAFGSQCREDAMAGLRARLGAGCPKVKLFGKCSHGQMCGGLSGVIHGGRLYYQLLSCTSVLVPVAEQDSPRLRQLGLCSVRFRSPPC